MRPFILAFLFSVVVSSHPRDACSLLVRLTLVKRDSKFYVTSQTDYYQPEVNFAEQVGPPTSDADSSNRAQFKDLAALVFPPLKGLILLQKSIGEAYLAPRTLVPALSPVSLQRRSSAYSGWLSSKSASLSFPNSDDLR